MKVNDVISVINQFADETWAFDRDNTGMQVGDRNADIDRILLCVDTTETVVDEAIEKGCNMIVSHHPLLFIPLRNVTTSSEKGRIIQKLIKNDITLYASHTNFDVSLSGINMSFAKEMGMQNTQFLDDWADNFNIIEFYISEESLTMVTEAMFEAGAGEIGNYKDCAYSIQGSGTFTPVNDADPAVGTVDQKEVTSETKIEMIVTKRKTDQVIAAMINAHPYETPVYRVLQPQKISAGIGIGVIGDIDKQGAISVIEKVKQICGSKTVRISDNYKGKTIGKVGFCGGSGPEYISVAKANGADLMITSECKSHDFVYAQQNGMILVCPTHFESESIFIRAMKQKLQEMINGIELIESDATDAETYY